MTAIHPDVRPEHPVVAKLRERRTADVQLRVADAITQFAGSMWFVYLHVVAFAVWMLFLESNPTSPSSCPWRRSSSRRSS